MPTYLDQFVIMARQSTDDEINQKNSLEFQVEHCLRFAESRTLPIAPLTIPYVIERGIIKEKYTANYLSNFSDEKMYERKSRKRLGNGGR